MNYTSSWCRGFLAFGLCLLVTIPASAQPATATVAGRVTDRTGGEPLHRANVLIVGTTKGTVTDPEGRYVIEALPPGETVLQASFIGFNTAQQRVQLVAGDTVRVDFALEEEPEIIIDHGGLLPPPLFLGAQDRITMSLPKVFERRAGQSPLPVRSVAGAAALLPGIDRDEGTDALRLRGGLGTGTSFFLNGLPVPDGIRLPWPAVYKVEVADGHVPVRYGDALSGVVAVTTEDNNPDGVYYQPVWQGRVEALTSEGLDAYGYNEATVTLQGRLLDDRLRLFVSGSMLRLGDGRPSALVVPRLNPVLLDDLAANPQALQAVNPNDLSDMRYVPLPGTVPDGATLSSFSGQLDVPAGYEIRSPLPLARAEILTPGDFSSEAGKPHNDLSRNTVFGALHADVTRTLTMTLGGYFDGHQRDQWGFGYTLFNDAPLNRTEDRAGRLYAMLRHDLTPNTFYEATLSYADQRATTFDPAFSDGTADLLFYGDIDHPARAAAGRYKTLTFVFDQDGEQVPAYVTRYRDGVLPGSFFFDLPGAAAGGFAKSRVQQRYGAAHVQIGHGDAHALTVGVMVEQRTERGFAFAPYGLARYYADGNPEQIAPDDSGLDPDGYATYDALPTFIIASLEPAYLGYDVRGQREVDGDDLAAFIGQERTKPDAAYHLAPFEPRRWAGYLREELHLGDHRVNLDLGLRVDVFDHNGRVLKDLFARRPIVRVGDLGGAAPPGIGQDDAVYFSGNDIVGFRNRDGAFSDANGQRISPGEILLRSQTRQTGAVITEAMFEAYTPQVVFQPRLAANVRAFGETWFFGYFNRMAQQPWASMRATLHQYQGVGPMDNAGLKPERVTSVGLGVRHSVADWGAVVASVFRRNYDDLVAPWILREASPAGYATFLNIGTAEVTGLEVAAEARLTHRAHFYAGYTLQEAQATGLGGAATSTIVFLDERPPAVTAPHDLDRRHQIKLLLTVQWGKGDGPTLFGRPIFSRLNVSLFADLKSGMPYTAITEPVLFGSNRVPQLAGGVNEARMPWSYLVNLRLGRTFTLAGAEVTLYTWIENLFDQNNARQVWPFTGEPDSDGFLDTPEGQLFVQNSPDLTEFLYSTRVNNPDHYGIPRLIRLGLQVDF